MNDNLHTPTPRQIGKVYHKCLELLFTDDKYKDEGTAIDFAIDYLRTHLDPAFMDNDKETRFVNFVIRTMEEVENVKDVIAEKKFGATFGERWTGCEFDDKDARIRGVVDRVDVYDDHLVVWDYKTGWGGHNELQGMMYALLLFANYPHSTGIEEVHVKFANPRQNFIKEGAEYEYSRGAFATSILERLAQAIDTVREVLPEPVSFSRMQTFFQCRKRFAMKYCGTDEGEATPSSLCAYCEKPCDLTEMSGSTINDLAGLHKALKGKMKAVDDEIKQLLDVEGGEVETDHGLVRFELSEPKPTPVSVHDLVVWFGSQEPDIGKIVQLKSSKKATEAIENYQTAGGEVKMKNKSAARLKIG